MELSPRKRRVLSSVLAVVLAAESVSAVAAAGLTARGWLTAAAPARREAAGAREPGREMRAAVTTRAAVVAGTTRAIADGRRVADGVQARKAARSSASTEPSSSPAPQPNADKTDGRAATTSKPPTRTPSSSKDESPANAHATTVRSGRNHVWIPGLNINRSVSWFPCDRKRPPDNYVYRWGCAGSNNVYLLGHAYSVFKPLHDAYVRGRLRKGMKAYYADARGRLHTYRVRWWKVTAPTTAASWAWAAQRRPSMTLQTCVGKNSAYRLMVRLVEVS